jgi:serine kinase of HPr protein (carbohydrate metabolism regulator)
LPQAEDHLPQTNIHATALVLGDRGILITGPSGSGKTMLALTLIDRFLSNERFARLVGDDQLFISARGSRLVVSCPGAIAGLAEVRGVGPRPLPALASAVIDLVVRLVPDDDASRLPDPASETIAGIDVPMLDLPGRNAAAASLAVTAWLTAPPFR